MNRFFKIMVIRDPDGDVMLEFYSSREDCLEDAKKLREAGFRTEIW